MLKEVFKDKKMFFWVVFYFTVSVLIRGFLSDFPKMMTVYSDELRYLGLARSIFHGNGLMIHNAPSSYQKILYSVTILPAFFFENPQIQIRVIGWINSILMSSAVFPAYGLAKRILKKDSLVHVVLVFLVTMPALVSTMYFMSEVLFLPLSLWIVYLVYRVIQEESNRRRMLWNVCLGLVFYAAYLNKEVALYYFIAYVIVRIGYIALHKDIWMKECICLGGMLAAFLLCFTVMKLTLFHGMGNSYNQMGLEAVSSLPKIIYLLYGFIYDLLFAVLAMGVFPVLMPAAAISKDQDDRHRQFFCFLIAALFIGCAAIAYTITVREDFPNRSPRQHLRYLEPLYIPFLISILSVFRDRKGRADKVMLKKMGMLLILYSFLFINVVYGIGSGPCVDQSALKYFEYLSIWLKPHALMELGVEWQMLLVRELFAAVWLAAFWLFCRLGKHRKRLFSVFLAGLLGLNLLNNLLAYRLAVPIYRVTAKTREEMENTNRFLQPLPGNLLLITEYSTDNGARLFDTYVDHTRLYQTSLDGLHSNGFLEDGVVSLDTEVTSDIILVNSQLHRVNWLIAGEGISFSEESVQEVEGFPLTGYKLYRNMEPDKIYIEPVPE